MRNPQIYTDLAAKPQFKVLPTEGGEAAVQSLKFKVQKKQITTNFPQIFSPADFADLADKAAWPPFFFAHRFPQIHTDFF